MEVLAGGRRGPARSFLRGPRPKRRRPRASHVLCGCDALPRLICEPSVADPTAVADLVTSLPSSGDMERVQKCTREPFVLEGESLQDALAPGSPRRLAFDEALAEVEAGVAPVPSLAWRRKWSLLLGL